MRRNLTGCFQVIAQSPEIPGNDSECAYGKDACENVKRSLPALGQLRSDKVHNHVALEPGGLGDGEAHHHCSKKADQLISPDDRYLELSQDYIGNREKHAAGQSNTRNHVHETGQDLLPLPRVRSSVIP